MPSRTLATRASLIAALALIVPPAVLAAAPPAAAKGLHGGIRERGPARLRGGEPYGAGYPDGGYPGAYGGGYGFAGEFVRGDYIGAPLTQIPSPQRIVPTPWSYGTYGVPTVSGIPPAPVAPPTLVRINARGGAVAGARVIDVQVPRR